MSFRQFLDTCTILPIRLCDLLLRVAEDPAFYKPKWSPHILKELEETYRVQFSISAGRKLPIALRV
jgi:hypothetical protein